MGKSQHFFRFLDPSIFSKEKDNNFRGMILSNIESNTPPNLWKLTVLHCFTLLFLGRIILKLSAAKVQDFPTTFLPARKSMTVNGDNQS